MPLGSRLTPKMKAIVNYFLQLAEDSPYKQSMTKLKVLKLIYAAHGYSLGLNDSPLFDEQVEAWQHGPVIPELYSEIADQSKTLEPFYNVNVKEQLTNQERNLITYVWKQHGYMSAFRLRNATHEHGTPWETTVKEQNNKMGPGIKIENQTIKEYYRNTICKNLQ